MFQQSIVEDKIFYTRVSLELQEVEATVGNRIRLNGADATSADAQVMTLQLRGGEIDKF